MISGDSWRRDLPILTLLLGIFFGIKLGDRVGTLAWNGYRHYELYFGVSGIGATFFKTTGSVPCAARPGGHGLSGRSAPQMWTCASTISMSARRAYPTGDGMCWSFTPSMRSLH